MTTAQYLEALEKTEVTRLVRHAINEPAAEVTDFASRPIDTGRSGASVFRVSGSARHAKTTTWSLILKFCTNIRRFGVEHDASDPTWQREYLLGTSGILDDAVPGLRPARFIDGTPLSPTLIAMWFEDVDGDWAQDWTIERYGSAAYHLGQFGAHFAARPPQQHWLGRDQWPDYVEDFCPDGVESLRRHQDHPAVLAVYPRALQQRLYALNDDRGALISGALATSTLTLSHGDTSGRNLFDVDGRTVAIDWDEVGLSPVGEDVARMVGSSLHWFFIGRMDQAAELADLTLARYLEGLQDGGCEQAPENVAGVFRAVLGTIYALSYTGIANGIVEDRIEERAHKAYKTTAPELLEHMGAIAAFCADQGDEARRLAAR